MKIIISISLFVFLHCSWSFGQFILQINAYPSDTCKNDSVKFIAKVTDGVNPITGVTYKWSFGDATPEESGLDLDTIRHPFKNEGGFIVRVDASKGANSDYLLVPVRMGLKPHFKGTVPSMNDSICLGQQIFLTGKTSSSIWKYKIPNTNTETNPGMISNTSSYAGNVDYRIFGKGANITAASNIDSIGINLEHSNLSTVKIELKCPNGTTLILKDFGGPDKFFGEPVDDEGSNLAGAGYDYFWTNTPTFGTMNSQAPAGNSLPPGTYTPQQAFTNLIGCPLNGKWEIIVTDNQILDNGFVFSGQVKFNASLLPATWQYSNTYSSPLWMGNGVSSTSGSGLATAEPVAYGNNSFTFRVKDNFGCFQDTSFNVSVEAVTFTTTPEPPTADINNEIGFANTTTWATTFEWDFRDQSPFATEPSTTHIYTRAGSYWAKLTAGTDDGCIDTANVLVVITVPISADFEMPNVFTPGNGDVINDRYKLSSLDGIQSLDCWIYSRWGKKVAEWHSIEEATEGWDGNFDGGQKASPGVYYYYLKAVGFDNKEYIKKGFFHLFR